MRFDELLSGIPGAPDVGQVGDAPRIHIPGESPGETQQVMDNFSGAFDYNAPNLSPEYEGQSWLGTMMEGSTDPTFGGIGGDIAAGQEFVGGLELPEIPGTGPTGPGGLGNRVNIGLFGPIGHGAPPGRAFTPPSIPQVPGGGYQGIIDALASGEMTVDESVPVSNITMTDIGNTGWAHATRQAASEAQPGGEQVGDIGNWYAGDFEGWEDYEDPAGAPASSLGANMAARGAAPAAHEEGHPGNPPGSDPGENPCEPGGASCPYIDDQLVYKGYSRGGQPQYTPTLQEVEDPYTGEIAMSNERDPMQKIFSKMNPWHQFEQPLIGAFSAGGGQPTLTGNYGGWGDTGEMSPGYNVIGGPGAGQWYWEEDSGFNDWHRDDSTPPA